jgi:hypothetical protein
VSRSSRDPLDSLLEGVKDEVSFLSFVDALSSDQHMGENPTKTPRGKPSKVTVQSSAEFLSGSSQWAKDSGFGKHPGPQPHNLWQQFALFLFAGHCRDQNGVA